MPSFIRGRRLPHCIVVFAVLIFGAGMAFAQQIPDAVSGRTKPPRPAGAETDTPWNLQVRGGMLSGGDLFKVRTEITRTWMSPAGSAFTSDKYTVTLDEGFLMSLGAVYELNPKLRLRCDLEWAQVDAAALARTGQTAQAYKYDEVSFVNVSFGVEAPLTSARSHPFLTAGLVVSRVSGMDDVLDRTGVGGRIGIGFEYGMNSFWSLRVEATDTFMQIETADYQDMIGDVASYNEYGSQNLFGLSGGMVVHF